jgi:S1-C subfamily serine protease
MSFLQGFKMNRHLLILLFMVSLNHICFGQQEQKAIREWKDSNEKVIANGRFVKIDDNNAVTIKNTAGLMLEFQLDQLSTTDQEYLLNTEIKNQQQTQKAASLLKKITTVKQLDDLVRQQYRAESGYILYKLFIRNTEIEEEEREKAKAKFSEIEKLASQQALRLGNKWILPEELIELRKREQTYLELAEVAYSDKNYEEAEKYFSSASNVNPDGIQADFRMGIIYALTVKNAVNATKHFEKTVARRAFRQDELTSTERANLAACLNNLAIAQVRVRQYLAATQSWTRALKLGYPSEEMIQNIGRLLEMTKPTQNSTKTVYNIKISLSERNQLDALYQEAMRALKTPTFNPQIGWLYIPLIGAGGDTNNPIKPEVKNNLRVVGYGTGFVVAPGKILTNAHVVEDADKLRLLLPNDDNSSLDAELLVASKKANLDLAILDSPSCKLPPVTISASMPKPGAELRMLGYPLPSALGRQLKVTRGTVTSIPPLKGLVGKLQDYSNCLLYDGTINPGNSGGPAINNQRGVVAVNTAILLPQAVGGGYAAGVTADDCSKFCKEHIPNFQATSEPMSMEWEVAVESVAKSVVQIAVLRNASITDPSLMKLNRPYEDRYCLACFGSRQIDCPNNDCANGTVRDFKTETIRYPNGAAEVKKIPIRVTCRTCSGNGKVRCPYCTTGTDPNLK